LNLAQLGIKIVLTNARKTVLKEKGISKLIYGIHSEEIRIVKKESGDPYFSGTVKFKQSMGAEDILNIKVVNGTLKAIFSPQLMIKDNDNVILNIEVSRSYLFESEMGKAVR
jgi:ABC-type sugar transport system ATPase subunit